ncbi:hypothetical protein TruAng_003726 [Truncatella angustata]|nr:hypothetical protein TruAng_003726 [Truncatella angustata]
MMRTTIARLGRAVSRASNGRTAAGIQASHPWIIARASFPRAEALRSPRRALSTSSALSRPVPPEALKDAQPADITGDQYHKLADEYIENLLVRYEEEQDARGELDVEYSSGVMNIKYPEGTYVINKQPPNKQIWLSSPKSGPKRFDYVVTSEGQDSKQDTATGGWVYLRDGTYLTEILQEETGINLDDIDSDAVESL